MRTIKSLARKHSRGFTLVELMIVVAIIGVLAALAIYGVSRYVANAKTAEARSALGAMAKGQVAAFNGEKMAGTALALGSSVGSGQMLCSTGAVVPASADSIKGQKYQSQPSDWAAGFKCLNFDMAGPQYFQYSFSSDYVDATTAASNDDAFKALAQGDLDGDGVLSTFSLGGVVKIVTGEAALLTVNPAITETDSAE